MEQGTDKNILRDLVFATLVGILFSRFSLGSLLMTVPLLLVISRARKTLYIWLSYIMLFLGAVLWTVIDGKELLSTQYAGMIGVSLFMPVCTIVGSAMWTFAGKKSKVGLRKYFLSCIPVICLGLAMALWFSSSMANPTKDLLKSSVLYMFPEETLGFSIETFLDTLISFLMLVYVPMGMIATGVPVLVSELLLYRDDEAWQYDFAFMKLPDFFVWGFLGIWILALASNFVQFPVFLTVACWNLALAFGVLYAVQGVSILVALFRRRTAVLSVAKVVALVFFLCMLPGLNIVAFVGLPILGVLETWIKFR